MSNYNLCVLVGNIVADPELTYLPSGVAKTSFTLAVNNPRATKEETLFMPVTFFGKLADVVMKYCKKGSSVLVSGRLNQFTFTKNTPDKDKTKHISLLASEIQFLGKVNRPEIEEPIAVAPREAPPSLPSGFLSAESAKTDNIPF